MVASSFFFVEQFPVEKKNRLFPSLFWDKNVPHGGNCKKYGDTLLNTFSSPQDVKAGFNVYAFDRKLILFIPKLLFFK